MFKALSRDTQGQAYRLPGVPMLFADECLSSWLMRCAKKYGFETSWEFVVSLLALDGLHLEQGQYDWDTSPPLVFLQVLEERTGVPIAQIVERLASPGASLRPGEKDAYCPQCFVDDLKNKAVYVRKAWIDPWVIKCSRHGCALGCYAARSLTRPCSSARERLWQELTPAGKVYPVHIPEPFWLTRQPVVSDQLALDHDWQRRIMLTLGFPCAKSLLYALTAQDDLTWLTDAAVEGDVGNVRAPMAKIAWRLRAGRAVDMLGAMATPRTMTIQEPHQLADALLEDLAQAQRWDRRLWPGRSTPRLVATNKYY